MSARPSTPVREQATKGPEKPIQPGDWADTIQPVAPQGSGGSDEDAANAGIRREPELPEHEEIVPEPRRAVHEFEPSDDTEDERVVKNTVLRQRGFARQVSLDPGDHMGL